VVFRQELNLGFVLKQKETKEYNYYFLLDGMLVHHRTHIITCNRLGVLPLPPLPGWGAGPSQGTQYKMPSSITIPPPPFLGWDASPSQDAQHKVTWSIIIPLGGLLVHHRLPSME